jgi:xanthine dehydrogenase molybdenum-binding subunit
VTRAQATNLARCSIRRPTRFRGLSVATNTPPRVSQRAPGGLQSSILFEPLVNKAAKQLGVDRSRNPQDQRAGQRPFFGLNPRRCAGRRPRTAKVTSSYVKECARSRRAALQLGRAQAAQRPAQRVEGPWRGRGYSTFTAGSIGMDGLFVLKPDGKMYIHQGIGNLGTHSVIDTARVVAEVMEFPWEKVEVVWGNTGRGIAWSSVQAGSQTTLRAHPRELRGRHRRQAAGCRNSPPPNWAAIRRPIASAATASPGLAGR